MENWKLSRMRSELARELTLMGNDTDKVYEWMSDVALFSDWSEWDADNRPVDVDEMDYLFNDWLDAKTGNPNY